MFRKKKKVKQEGTLICINESILETKEQSVVRCVDIQAHFNTSNEEEVKQATHYMVRKCLIAIGHTMTSDDVISRKEEFQEAVKMEVNRTIANLSFSCDRLLINSISKIERRR